MLKMSVMLHTVFAGCKVQFTFCRHRPDRRLTDPGDTVGDGGAAISDLMVATFTDFPPERNTS